MCVQVFCHYNHFRQGIAHGVTLIGFNAPWCAPCRSQAPILEALARQYHTRATVAAMNLDNNPEMAATLKIESIPTLIVFKNQKEIRRLVGLQPATALADALDNALL